MDLGLLAGEDFSVLPGILPLVSDQCTVLGGSSGLFSVFEPNGLQVVTLVDVSILAPLIRHVGSSSTSPVDASVVQNPLSVKIVA